MVVLMDDDDELKPRARRMLTLEQVLELVPVGRTTLMRMIASGEFPHGNFISANKRIWYEDVVQRWQDALPEESPRKRARRAKAQ
jgi:predicted DNA-binding transcriptional regulator AlpA